MWFGEPGYFLPESRFLLLGISSVVLAAVIQVWAARGAAPWWMRWGVVLAIAALLIQVKAPELVLFLAGHLLAILALVPAAVVRRSPTGSAARRCELLAILLVLGVELTFATIVASTQPLRWFVIGAGAGGAAAIVDFGMKRRSVTAATGYGFLAVSLSLICTGIGYGNPLGIVEKITSRYPIGEWGNVFEVLGGGTFFYWVWRLLLRLSMRGDTDEDRPAGASLRVESNLGTPSVEPKRFWWRAGEGWRLVLRVAFVWPAFLLLSVGLVSPTLEAYWRLPPQSSPPAPVRQDKNYQELLAFPDTLNASSAEFVGEFWLR